MWNGRFHNEFALSIKEAGVSDTIPAKILREVEKKEGRVP